MDDVLVKVPLLNRVERIIDEIEQCDDDEVAVIRSWLRKRGYA